MFYHPIVCLQRENQDSEQALLKGNSVFLCVGEMAIFNPGDDTMCGAVNGTGW